MKYLILYVALGWVSMMLVAAMYAVSKRRSGTKMSKEQAQTLVKYFIFTLFLWPALLPLAAAGFVLDFFVEVEDAN